MSKFCDFRRQGRGKESEKKAKKFSVGAAGVAPETIVLGVACKPQASGQEAIGGLGQQRETNLWKLVSRRSSPCVRTRVRLARDSWEGPDSGVPLTNCVIFL